MIEYPTPPESQIINIYRTTFSYQRVDTIATNYKMTLLDTWDNLDPESSQQRCACADLVPDISISDGMLPFNVHKNGIMKELSDFIPSSVALRAWEKIYTLSFTEHLDALLVCLQIRGMRMVR